MKDLFVRTWLELVYDVVKQIPEGCVTTYGEVAKALGDVRAARAVGEALSMNRNPDVPCHRVVMGDGRVGGYAWGVEEKIRRLREEGVKVVDGRVEGCVVKADELKAFPLFERMRKAQEKLAEKRVEERVDGERYAGVDVAYRKGKAFAAVVVTDAEGRVVEKKVASCDVMFPYVPTYLAFREMPAVAKVVKGVDFDVLFVDGHGLIHPRKAGEAVHFGVVLDVPAVGVAKSGLVGKVVGEKVVVDGEVRGHVVDGGYVSPGNYFSVEGAVEMVRKVKKEKNQPVCLKEAHRAATKAAREWAEGFEQRYLL